MLANVGNAPQLQSVALKVLSRVRGPGRDRIPLFHPRTMLHTRGAPVAHIYDDVFCARTYESPKPLPRQPRVVDAGAHLGMASLFFLQRYPDAQLTSFEPNPNLAPLLRQNLAPWRDRVRVVEAALSTEPGTATFHLTANNPFNVTGGLSNREAASRETVSFTVSCVSAEEALRAPVDLMKLDVEGHEYVLLQLPLFRADHVANLMVEFHDIDRRRDEFQALLALLVKRGYRICDSNNVALELTEAARSTDSVVLKFY